MRPLEARQGQTLCAPESAGRRADSRRPRRGTLQPLDHAASVARPLLLHPQIPPEFENEKDP